MRVSQFRFYPSAHGIILILLHAYLLVDPVLQENDLVASALVTCFGIVCFTAMIATLLCGLRTRRSFQIGITPVAQGDNSKFFAADPCQLDVMVFLKLLPGIQAKVSLQSEFPHAPEIECLFTNNNDRVSRVATVFPHRGNWRTDSALIKISDRFGLWTSSFEASLDAQSISIEIHPAPCNALDYPIVQSTEREGDISISTNQPTGDMYDIKRYHPTDGIRKIVWKVYARTGELLSRHPEPTMTPEGKTVVFASGGAFNDAAYSAALHYAELREQEGFDVLLSGSTFPNDGVCRTSQDFLHTSIESAFHPADAAVIDQLIATAISDGGILKQVAIFVDLNNNIQESVKLTEEAVKIVEDAGLTPIIMTVSTQPLIERMTPRHTSALSSHIKKLIKEKDAVDVTDKEDIQKITDFIQFCENRQWQIV